MTSRLHTQMKNSRAEVSTFANAQNLETLQPHRLDNGTYSVTQAQHKDQKTSLMQAARYGHNLSQINFANQSAPQVIQPKQETGVRPELVV